jgi:hypothetical protein
MVEGRGGMAVNQTGGCADGTLSLGWRNVGHSWVAVAERQRKMRKSEIS